jgi:hypothetical protein
MKQKFKKLSFVHVCKDMPSEMRHFPSDFDAIVEGTYKQLCGGDDVDSYSLYMLQNGKIVNCISWYYEDQLTLLPYQDKIQAKKLIEKYESEDDESAE